jgi:hypothetical protein
MMNSFLRHLALVSFCSALSLNAAQADDSVRSSVTLSPQLLASASYPTRSNNNSDNGAIRRANPNSRQGTQSISPTMRGPNLGPTQQRPPTLENGGIGNGYPSRQPDSRPSSGTERRSN